MQIFTRFFRKLPDDQYPVLTAKSLLKPHREMVQEARSIVGLPRQHWDALYQTAIERFALYVQELPASEVHHHSGRGGLLAHGIEVMVNALRIRTGKLLPPNADAETVTRFKDLWTYAVFTAALAHDLGKPITDVRVDLFDATGGSLPTWSPFTAPMGQTKSVRSYAVSYVHKRAYVSHQRASSLYVHHIVPDVGLNWLLSDTDVFFHWTNCITGHDDEAGLLGQIIHDADRQSVAANLAGDQVNVSSAATTSRKPLHQRVMTCLRNQIDQGNLPLNRDGAAGWIVDGQVWLVVKRALDLVRESMTQEGQTGVPSRNDRIMDELQQYQILIPCGDKAVWKCQVFSPDWPKAHELTLLCFPVERLWASEDSVPEAFAGTVTPVGQLAAVVEDAPTESATTHASTATAAPATPDEAASDDSGTALTQPVATPSIDEPMLNLGALAGLTTNSGESESESDDTVGGESTSTDNVVALDVQGNNPLPGRSMERASSTTESETNSPASDDDKLSMRFVKWLRDGLHSKDITVNTARAKVHRTQEGVLLVSPAIFKEFDQTNWKTLQNKFTKLKLHEPNPDGKSFHTYVARGKKKTGRITGFLITDTNAAFPNIELPSVNHALSKEVAA